MSDAIFFWLAPGMLAIFAAVFALIAAREDNGSARWAALGYTAGVAAILADTLRHPDNLWLMALATVLHWHGLAAITNAVAVRRGPNLPGRWLAAVLCCGIAMLVFTTFIERDPNLGIANANLVGAAILMLALPTLLRARGRLVDNLILGAVALSAASYVLRAVLFLPLEQGFIDAEGGGFWSLYNITFYLATGFFGVVSAVLLLVALGSDMIHRHYLASGTDHLTGLPNRRSFERWIDEARDGAAAYGAVIMVDLDNFKRINDRHGHAAGDEVLAVAAHALRGALANRGRLARVGGEEFAALIFAPAVDAGVRAAEDMRAALAAAAFASLPDGITGSFGVAGVTQQRVRAAMREADRAVYAAKEAGRDRVMLARPDLLLADYEVVAAE